MCDFLVEVVLVPNLPTCQNCPGYWMALWLETKKRNSCLQPKRVTNHYVPKDLWCGQAEDQVCHCEVSLL